MNTNITRFASACSLLASALVAWAQPATSLAAGAVVGADITVRYDDLAIDKPAGAIRLLNRIQVAASSVCDPLAHGDLSSRTNRDNCRAHLVAAAVAKVNKPMLFAVYTGAVSDLTRVADAKTR